MAQFLRPSADVSVGSWSPTPAYIRLDAADGVTVASEDVSNGVSSTAYVASLDAGSTPQGGAQTLRVRWRSTSNRAIQGTIELWEGAPGAGTLRHTFQSPAQMTTGWVDSAFTVSAVANYSNVHCRLTGFGSGGGPARGLEVDRIEYEIPNAGSFPTITGSMAASESGADTFAASGAVVWPTITGSMAAVEAGLDTFDASGSTSWPTIVGTVAAVESGSDSFTASGALSWPLISGSMSAVESGQDTFAASGGLPTIVGSMAAVETGADSFSASGSVSFPTITGAMAVVETGGDSFAASGSLSWPTITGSMAAAESGSDTFLAVGSSGFPTITGSVSIVEQGSDTLSASGSISWPTIIGTMAAMESGSDTFSASDGSIYQGQGGLSDLRLRVRALEAAARAAGWDI